MADDGSALRHCSRGAGGDSRSSRTVAERERRYTHTPSSASEANDIDRDGMVVSCPVTELALAVVSLALDTTSYCHMPSENVEPHIFRTGRTYVIHHWKNFHSRNIDKLTSSIRKVVGRLPFVVPRKFTRMVWPLARGVIDSVATRARRTRYAVAPGAHVTEGAPIPILAGDCVVRETILKSPTHFWRRPAI